MPSRKGEAITFLRESMLESGLARKAAWTYFSHGTAEKTRNSFDAVPLFPLARSFL